MSTNTCPEGMHAQRQDEHQTPNESTTTIENGAHSFPSILQPPLLWKSRANETTTASKKTGWQPPLPLPIVNLLEQVITDLSKSDPMMTVLQ